MLSSKFSGDNKYVPCPRNYFKKELNKVLSLPIDDAEKELILSKNVKRLIDLD
jgi:predicted TIM-barrel fold metal-dependent hydrolase